MGILNGALAAVAPYLPDDTRRIQAALWAIIVLTLVYAVWELIGAGALPLSAMRHWCPCRGENCRRAASSR